jgi:ferrochelatase
VSRPYLEKSRWDKVLFSFHGVPERHVRKTDPTGTHCLEKSDCCAVIDEKNALCYRAQCFATAHSLTERLEIPKEDAIVCFQSRLGRTPWIRPYTDHFYETLPKEGVKDILVLTPSFVADCLETLEEVQIRGREQFQEAGGRELTMVPSLNADPVWGQGLNRLVTEQLEKAQFKALAESGQVTSQSARSSSAWTDAPTPPSTLT